MREYPQDWTQSNLSELAEVAIGGTPSRDVPRYWAMSNTDGLPWVAISDLRSRVIERTSEHITEAGVENSNVKLVKRGTVLMSFKLSLGRMAYAGCDLFTNEAIAAFFVNGKVTEDYLFYSMPDAVRLAATDVAIKGATLNKQSLKKLRISYPGRANQEKITRILTTIDTAIEKTEALIEKYQQIKAGLMHDLFTRGVLPNGQLRPPREQAPELYQETAIGWIPRDWQAVRLGECSDVFNGTTPRREFQPYWGGSVPWLSSGKVNEYKVVSSDEFVTQRALKETSLKIVPSGSVIVAMIGQGKTRGMSARLGINASINQNLAAIIPTQTYSSIYLHWYLQHNYTRLRGDGRGSNQEALNCQLVRSFLVALPRHEEQLRLSTAMLAFEAQEELAVFKLNKLRSQKLGLMQDLLTGKVAVQVNDEAPELVDG